MDILCLCYAGRQHAGIKISPLLLHVFVKIIKVFAKMYCVLCGLILLYGVDFIFLYGRYIILLGGFVWMLWLLLWDKCFTAFHC
jgi:hypothetical protein